MIAQKFKFFIVVILIVAVTLPTIPFESAQAQWVVTDPGSYAATGAAGAAVSGTVAASAAAELAGKTAQTTVLGFLLNDPVEQAGILTAQNTAEAACKGIDQAEQIVSTADSFGDFTLIGGGAAQATKLTAKLAALKVVKLCREAMLEALNATPATSVVSAQFLAKKQNDLSSEINSLNIRIEDIKKQQTAEIKDVLKAIMVRILLNLNKSLTTKMVNKMVDKFKISDYNKYSDAVASQIYSMKYITDHYDGEAQNQMMIRSLLQSDRIPEKIKTAQAAASSKAQDYLGSVCPPNAGASNTDLSVYVKCLASYGSPQADSQYHMFQGIDKAEAARQAGIANTNAEISQSNGFAPPRDCSGSISLQKSIDSQFDQVANAKIIAEATRDKLLLALKAGKTTQEEYQKAVAAADQAIANYNQVNKQKENKIIDICEAITSPSTFVSTSIGDFLKQHFDQTSNIKTDNLPFYATFIADMASNFLTNILTGGKSASQVFKESGSAGISAALGGLNSALEGNNPTGAITTPTFNQTPPTGSSTGTPAGAVNGASIILPRGPEMTLR